LTPHKNSGIKVPLLFFFILQFAEQFESIKICANESGAHAIKGKKINGGF
jgi:hypothetical protein